jgi:multiple antibiotic resistance protein
MNFQLFLGSLVAFLALINPVHKIMVMTSLQNDFSDKELRYITYKANLTAGIILILFLFVGEVVFNYVFHIQLYSFKIVCGAVLIFNGLSGLQKGMFFKVDKNIKVADLTAVPIAMPMIAGPATITAAVTFPSHYGKVIVIISIIVALGINLLIMLNAKRIGNVLIRYNFMNALIRIFGLIVATIGLQLALDGLSNYIQNL